MLNLFKKKIPEKELTIPVFEVELIGSVLAYEIARSDGEISDDEAALLLGEIKKISEKVGKDEKDILKLIETYSNDSVSFYEFIEDINKHFTKKTKFY